MYPFRLGDRYTVPPTALQYVRATVAVAVLSILLGCNGGSSSPSAPPQPTPEGAIFRVAVLDETFHILLQGPEQIAEADGLLAEASQKLVHGRVRRGDGGFNQPWSWHLEPETVNFPDACGEILDGRPSHVEGDVDHWVDEIMYYCSWGSHLVARVR